MVVSLVFRLRLLPRVFHQSCGVGTAQRRVHAGWPRVIDLANLGKEALYAEIVLDRLLQSTTAARRRILKPNKQVYMHTVNLPSLLSQVFLNTVPWKIHGIYGRI